MEALVGLSSSLARRWYGLVYPRDSWWLKLMWRALTPLLALWLWVQRNSYRAYLHPTKEVDALVRANGFRQRFARRLACGR